MLSLPLDTAKTIKNLRNAGMAEEQAIGITYALFDAMQQPTVQGFQDVRNDLARLNEKMDWMASDIRQSLRTHLMYWFVGVGIVQIAIIAGVAYLLSY